MLMNDQEFLRKTLTDLLEQASSLTQAQLADGVGFNPSKLSRLLSGETELTKGDAIIIAKGIATDRARQFADYLGREWKVTDPPPFSHANLEHLWQAELALQELTD